MRILLTGVAGFIGSNLAQQLLMLGHNVVGVDSFDNYYDVKRKRRNIGMLIDNPQFRLLEGDLRRMDLTPAAGTDVAVHQAGQPGVRESWSRFGNYVENNVIATKALLDWLVEVGVSRIVYASSSSVYGEAPRYPTREVDLPNPRSPYGVTKLAAEHLVEAYGAAHGLQVYSLRYFTVYGPRQRPDMALHRIIEACLTGQAFKLFGDGSQVRDFTYVDDIVRANLAALSAPPQAQGVYNIAGGSELQLKTLIRKVEELVGVRLSLLAQPAQPGDVARTGACAAKAHDALGWSPIISLDDGLAEQVKWHKHERMA